MDTELAGADARSGAEETLGALGTLALSTGMGLSPGSCLLPHLGGGPDVVELDESLGSRKLGNQRAALLQAPVFALPGFPPSTQAPAPHFADPDSAPSPARGPGEARGPKARGLGPGDKG